MNLLDCIQYKPYIKSIVTENPWMICNYDRENVRVWKDNKWRMPNNQTYGASVNHIMHTILKIRCTVAANPMDGGEAIRKMIKELEK